MPACLTPFGVKKKTDPNTTINVPCGKCPNCIKRRVSGWSFRLMQEDKISMSAHFITLTYDTATVPITRNGFMSINKRDLQLFFKRLRKTQPDSGVSIKYYAVGEYGGRTMRPHYHIILFNAKLETISPAWNQGHVHYGQLTAASVGYTLKYITKPSKIPLHQNDDRTREFSLMSKGLGSNYLTEAMKAWHKKDLDNRMYCNLTDGKKIAMPRYYKDKLYSESERKRVAHFSRLAMQKSIEEEMKKQGDDYWNNKAQSALAAFKRQNFHSTKRDTL